MDKKPVTAFKIPYGDWVKMDSRTLERLYKDYHVVWFHEDDGYQYLIEKDYENERRL